MQRKLRASARRLNKNHRADLVHVVVLPKLVHRATTVWYAPAGLNRGNYPAAIPGPTPDEVAANRAHLARAVAWCTEEFGPPAFQLVGPRFAATPRWTQDVTDTASTVAFKFREAVDAAAFRILFG